MVCALVEGQGDTGRALIWSGTRPFAGRGGFELNFNDCLEFGQERNLGSTSVLGVPKNLTTPRKSLLEVGMALVHIHRSRHT